MPRPGCVGRRGSLSFCPHHGSAAIDSGGTADPGRAFCRLCRLCRRDTGESLLGVSVGTIRRSSYPSGERGFRAVVFTTGRGRIETFRDVSSDRPAAALDGATPAVDHTLSLS